MSPNHWYTLSNCKRWSQDYRHARSQTDNLGVGWDLDTKLWIYVLTRCKLGVKHSLYPNKQAQHKGFHLGRKASILYFYTMQIMYIIWYTFTLHMQLHGRQYKGALFHVLYWNKHSNSFLQTYIICIFILVHNIIYAMVTIQGLVTTL